MSIHQLERLKDLAKQIQRVGFCHVHYIGNLLPSCPLGGALLADPVRGQCRRRALLAQLSNVTTGSAYRMTYFAWW